MNQLKHKELPLPTLKHAKANLRPANLNKKQILLAINEPDIREAVRHRLTIEGYRIVTASNGEEAVAIAQKGEAVLAILDLNLPNLNGLEACCAIKETTSVPVVIVSHRNEEIDRFASFRLGADDFLVKPFSPSELAFRVTAILRRTIPNANVHSEFASGHTVTVGPLRLDQYKRKASLNGQAINLTAKEFDLLWLLATYPDRVVSKSQIISRIWEKGRVSDPRVLTVLVSRLREKIEPNPSNPTFIKTVRGLGYKFTVPRPL